MLAQPPDRRHLRRPPDDETVEQRPGTLHLPRSEMPGMRSCVEPYLGVLCLVIAAASGIAAPACAQERGDSVRVRLMDGNRMERRLLAIDSSKVAVRWRLDDHVFPLKEVTRLDGWRLGRDRADQSFRLLPRRMACTPRLQRLNSAGVTTARGLAEPRGNAECPRLLRSCNLATSRWAVPELAPSFDPWTVVLQQAGNAAQQGIPLPAYDDMGNPISRREIEARMRSGGGGGVMGGLLGALVGGGVGLVMACNISPCEIFGPPSSPREDAFAVVTFLSGLVWGIAFGAIAGSETSGIDRWEALEQIRAERRRAATRRGQ